MQPTPAVSHEKDLHGLKPQGIIRLDMNSYLHAKIRRLSSCFGLSVPSIVPSNSNPYAIERSLAGHDPEKLAGATDLLVNACTTFESVGHKAYLARAAFELSLTHLYAGDTAAADRERARVEEISSERDDVRWSCNSLILESRIRRVEGDFRAAEDLASRACIRAENRKQFLCQIDALIARAEARMMLQRFAQAQKDLEDASAFADELSPSSTAIPALRASHLRNCFSSGYIFHQLLLDDHRIVCDKSFIADSDFVRTVSGVTMLSIWPRFINAIR
jgi:hypothetical protein